MNILYKLEARAIGTDQWYPFSMSLMSAEQAITAIANLSSDDTTVYRAVPLKD